MQTGSPKRLMKVEPQNHKGVKLVTFYTSECLPMQEGDFHIRFHNKEILKWKRNDR